MAAVCEGETTTWAAKGNRDTPCRWRIPPWLPLSVLPCGVGWLCADWPAWQFMWMVASAIFAGLKWLTIADCPAAARASVGRRLGYVVAWPGMDAVAFFESETRAANREPAALRRLAGPADRGAGRSRRREDAIRAGEWCWALATTSAGLFLFFVAPGLVVADRPLAAGWLGGIGLILLLHFGTFHLLSLGWRRAGIAAPPIMQGPLRSTSVAEFWGRRWNMAFRDLAHAYVFRPCLRTLGGGGAMLAVFLVSGLVHDVVISIPAGAGYGWPTLYFVLQGLAVLVERCRFSRRIGLGSGVRGRLFCAAVTVGPVCLLFHRPFVERVMLPMLAVAGGG